MTSRPTTLRQRERGYSLAEILVAVAIFTVIIVAALVVYDRSNKVFKQSVESSDMQQSTRVAFDKLVSDIRLTGFDYDRDGRPSSSLANDWKPNTTYVKGDLVQPSPANGYTYICVTPGTSAASAPTWSTSVGGSTPEQAPSTVVWQTQGNQQYQQPDEQIEYAGKSALTIRANFDYETETGQCNAGNLNIDCENGREPRLQSNFFPVVTTGNDEIVTYALVPMKASAPTSSMTFYADTFKPRAVYPGGPQTKEKAVTITGIDTCNSGCNNPPYTLMRYTLAEDGTPQGTPIADNIRSLTFHYYTDTAATVEVCPGTTAPCNNTALPLGAGQYDDTKPDQVIPERDTRASIKAIRVQLVGMNPNPDAAFKDTTDTVAPTYRKYPLESVVVPRNIGRHGMKEFSSDPPGMPQANIACAGLCNSVYVTWQAPPNGGSVDSYSILYDTGNCPAGSTTYPPTASGAYTYAEDVGSNLSGYAGLSITPGQQWHFAVQAINKYGSAVGNCVAVNVLNSTTPSGVTNMDASGGDSGKYATLPGAVTLYWDADLQNSVTNTVCSDGSPRTEAKFAANEKRLFRIYRSTNKNLQGTKLVDENTPAAQQPQFAGSQMTWTDTTAVNCVDYYYRIQPLSYCVLSNAWNQSNNTNQATGVLTPAIGSDGLHAIAIDPTNKPSTPTGISATTPGSCNPANTCARIAWSAVTTMTNGTAVSIDTYLVKEYMYDPATDTWPLQTSQSVNNGVLTADFTGLDTAQIYRFTVTALQGVGGASACPNSDESAPVYWPCNFLGGSLNAAPDTNYGGSGSQGDPYVINHPWNLVVSTSGTVSSITVTLFIGNTSNQFGSTTTLTNPAQTISVPMPQLTDNVVMRARVVATDKNGCTIRKTVWVEDLAAPNCAISDYNTDPSVRTFTTPNDDYIIKNNSSHKLKILGITVTWDPHTSNTGNLDSITFNQTGTPNTISTSCNKATTSAAPSTTQIVNANDTSSYRIRVTFTGNGPNLPTSDPVSAVCLQYQDLTTGDILTCSLSNAGTCALGASCQ
jgi:prepilin-type N-terminal cleavage/methylation domain-containing protein